MSIGNVFNRTLGVVEDLETVERRHLVTLFGIEWLATPYAPLSLVNMMAGGLLIAGVTAVVESLPVGDALLRGLLFGAILIVTNLLHTIGHMISGWIARAPMDANLVTATRHINIYRGEEDDFTKWQHIGRALGGPLMNTIVGAAAFVLWQARGGAGLEFLALVNLVFGLGAFVPVPSVDGWVIWGRLFGLQEQPGEE